MTYWDNERVLDYLTTQFNHASNDVTVPRLYPVKIFISSSFVLDKDGNVDDVTEDTQNAIGDFEDLADKINSDAADNDNYDVPEDAYAVCRMLNSYAVTPNCHVPANTVFRGYVTEDHLDAIDALIYHYSHAPHNHVHFHIRKL